MPRETVEPRRYVRVYYDQLADEFPEVYADDGLLATWLRLLVVAERNWPALAEVPRSVRARHLARLVEVGLVEDVQPYCFRIRGLDAERTRRRNAARIGPAKRWQSERTADDMQSHSERSAIAMPSTRTSTSTSTSTNARDGLPNLTPEAIAILEDKTGRPWSQAGDKQLGEYDRLVGDHGLERVTAAFDEVCSSMDEKPTARQLVWPAMKAIEPMPSLRVVVEDPDDEEQKARDRRRNEAVWNRRLEWHRNTGQWDEAWGPEPVISGGSLPTSKGNQ